MFNNVLTASTFLNNCIPLHSLKFIETKWAKLKEEIKDKSNLVISKL